MQAVKSKDTAPELLVRSLAHRMGYRFRLHRKDLPGRPDLVFPGRRKAIFVHGCFWHGHDCEHGLRRPKTNVAFWEAKARDNRARDARKETKLSDTGWKVLVVWECQVKRNVWL